MSQTRRAMNLIEKESGLKGRLLKPLSAKLLPETDAEKNGLVDRKKLYDIYGRKREKQIALAKKFKISYPTPGGGCLLCEKALKKRLKYLLDRGMNKDEIKLVGIGRHFVLDDCWIVLGRNKEENKIIEIIGKKYNSIVPDFAGPSAVIFDKSTTSPTTTPNKEINKKVNELIKTYSKKGSLRERKRFEKYKL